MADLVRNGKKKRTVRRALYGPGAFLIACAALIFLMSIFFRVSSVEVRGNSYYTAEEVEDASGIIDGDNLFFINRFSVVSRIVARLPYVESVEITRYLPNKVVITISESQALACVSYEGEPWVIDRSCRMLTQADQAEAASLYAEYAMDFATQAMQYALIVALTAMDLQRNAEEKKEEQTP